MAVPVKTLDNQCHQAPDPKSPGIDLILYNIKLFWFLVFVSILLIIRFISSRSYESRDNRSYRPSPPGKPEPRSWNASSRYPDAAPPSKGNLYMDNKFDIS